MRHRITNSLTLICISLTIISCYSHKEVKLCTDTNLERYNSECCPVVGNDESGIFHTPGGQFYGMMLVKNKGHDNRVCFRTESDAEKVGYRASMK
ncbi:hypothetical protein ACRXCV_12105 [Halobacteriovorax sp. GFR7]|uniref:sunset domain-containing protein n=1 Tax=unclassified Halobacteriovorax TaxID=2639665 RepID=UPI003D993825